MEKEVRNTVLISRKIENVVVINELNSFFIYNFDKDYRGFDESHRENEFIFILDGQECVYEDDKTYILSKGQALLHKPFAVHKDNPINGNSKICEFTFVGMVKNIDILHDKVLDLTSEQMYLLNDIFNYAVKHYYIDEIQTFYSGRDKDKNTEIGFGSDQILKNKVELFLIDCGVNEEQINNIKRIMLE